MNTSYIHRAFSLVKSLRMQRKCNTRQTGFMPRTVYIATRQSYNDLYAVHEDCVNGTWVTISRFAPRAMV
eukprot:11504958-Karenia_brevis.AAC.1